MAIDKKFYLQDADILAPLLLGKILVRRLDNGQEIRCRITETECYLGEEDSACHAHKGRTNRTDIMYSKGGVTYVYLCYGIHNLLNIVTGAEGNPQAVLIRGIEQASGPGRVTKFLQIDRSHNGINLTTGSDIWLEDDGYIPKYITTPRIGIDYAKDEDRNRLWRYLTTSTV
ncbi:MAG: DNA-3-methyladenine glycosylase [Firmicutes bacterium]|nr:DNA-3-methyladenine glycosylase [Bacillota bacterium]